MVELIETKHGQFEQKLTFQYDPFGRRIWKKVYTTAHPNEHDYDYAEEYIWQGNKRIQTRHFDNRRRCVNNEITIYRPGTHVPLAIIDNTLGILDIDTDHLGTPKAMYDHNTGNEVWSISHEVYGKSRVNQILPPHLNQPLHPKTGRPLDPKIRFQGQYEDLETGLYQNLHRYYDPNCGRYLTPDPIGLMGGLNQYQYCPNPVSYIDPLGLSCKEVADSTQAKLTFDSTLNPVDQSFAKQAGDIIADDPIASAYYAKLQQQGTDVRFVNDLEMEEMGLFDRANNTVTVNMAKHKTPQEVASTVVHEGTHQFRFYKTGNAGTQYEEYLAFRNESFFETGIKPDLIERKNIWSFVQDAYPELSQGKYPFGGVQK